MFAVGVVRAVVEDVAILFVFTSQEPPLDETLICKFYHLMECHELGDRLFARVNDYLARHGLGVRRGTVMDTSIIDAPPGTLARHV